MANAQECFDRARELIEQGVAETNADGGPGVHTMRWLDAADRMRMIGESLAQLELSTRKLEIESRKVGNG